MGKKALKKSLVDAYQFAGFKTSAFAKGKLGDKSARVLLLSRRSKKTAVINVGGFIKGTTTAKFAKFATFRAAIAGFILKLKFAGFIVERQD